MSAGTTPILLYVEDEESDIFLVRRAFERDGLQDALRIVTTGDAAIKFLSNLPSTPTAPSKPATALVLLDLHLPGMDGFDVLKWIRVHPAHSNLHVVVFSSSSLPEDRARA